MNRPQLISPAGTLKSMRYAFAYGADAVYAGQPRYSLRVRKNEFATLDSLAQGISEAHAQGKQFYLTANILAHNAKVKTFLNDIAPLIELQPDALIMADPGLIMQVRQRWPDLAIHLSVQANTMNYASVQFWQAFGIQRLILSRELSLADIAEIRQQCPQIELEVFVHGALCIAYSGRCLLSGYFNHRDANQGSCTNACRWSYKLHGTYEQDDTIFLLEEQLRPQEYMPIFEDEHGSYIMNSKDLRAIQHISALKAIGIDAFKIEGRTKSFYYVARTARTYRRAIDTADEPFDYQLLEELEGLAHRGYTEGFYRRHLPEAMQNYLSSTSRHHRQLLVGEVEARDGALLTITVKNQFALGDQLEFITPQGQNRPFILNYMENQAGEPIPLAPGAGYQVRIDLPDGVAEEVDYGLLLKMLPEPQQ